MPLTVRATVTTYLTPNETTVPDLFIQMIDAARHSIRFCIYSATLPGFIDAIIRAHARGVDVKGIFDHTEANQAVEAPQLARLCASVPSSQFRIGTSPEHHAIVHEKGLWTDSMRVWSGSWNFSNAATAEVNAVDVISSQKRAAYFQAGFDALWTWIDANEAAYQPAPATPTT